MLHSSHGLFFKPEVSLTAAEKAENRKPHNKRAIVLCERSSEAEYLECTEETSGEYNKPQLNKELRFDFQR
jgi:hypothetical protein